MNKVIEWLFQRTANGATYLQVIIVGLLFITLFNFIFKTLEKIKDELDNPTEEEDNDEI